MNWLLPLTKGWSWSSLRPSPSLSTARPFPLGTLRSERTISDLSTFLLASEV